MWTFSYVPDDIEECISIKPAEMCAVPDKSVMQYHCADVWSDLKRGKNKIKIEQDFRHDLEKEGLLSSIFYIFSKERWVP